MVCSRVVKTYYYSSVGSSSLHCFCPIDNGGPGGEEPTRRVLPIFLVCIAVTATFKILCAMTEIENNVFCFRTSWNIICVITTNAGTFQLVLHQVK